MQTISDSNLEAMPPKALATLATRFGATVESVLLANRYAASGLRDPNGFSAVTQVIDFLSEIHQEMAVFRKAGADLDVEDLIERLPVWSFELHFIVERTDYVRHCEPVETLVRLLADSCLWYGSLLRGEEHFAGSGKNFIEFIDSISTGAMQTVIGRRMAFAEAA